MVSKNCDLDSFLRKLTKGELKADLFGVADLSQAAGFIKSEGGDFLTDLSKGISIGVRLQDDIVNKLKHHSNPNAQFNYAWHAYEVVTPRLDYIASIVSGELQSRGYEVHQIPATYSSAFPPAYRTSPMDGRGMEDIFISPLSHKLSAHLAGLGWIGKSCLLINPDYGPRARYTTVLTDVPLPTGEPMEERCGDCSRCVDICPVDAFTGKSFDPSDPLEARMNPKACHEYRNYKMQKKFNAAGCGLCIYVCPWGGNQEKIPEIRPIDQDCGEKSRSAY